MNPSPLDRFRRRLWDSFLDGSSDVQIWNDLVKPWVATNPAELQADSKMRPESYDSSDPYSVPRGTYIKLLGWDPGALADREKEQIELDAAQRDIPVLSQGYTRTFGRPFGAYQATKGRIESEAFAEDHAQIEKFFRSANTLGYTPDWIRESTESLIRGRNLSPVTATNYRNLANWYASKLEQARVDQLLPNRVRTDEEVEQARRTVRLGVNSKNDHPGALEVFARRGMNITEVGLRSAAYGGLVMATGGMGTELASDLFLNTNPEVAELGPVRAWTLGEKGSHLVGTLGGGVSASLWGGYVARAGGMPFHGHLPHQRAEWAARTIWQRLTGRPTNTVRKLTQEGLEIVAGNLALNFGARRTELRENVYDIGLDMLMTAGIHTFTKFGQSLFPALGNALDANTVHFRGHELESGASLDHFLETVREPRQWVFRDPDIPQFMTAAPSPLREVPERLPDVEKILKRQNKETNALPLTEPSDFRGPIEKVLERFGIEHDPDNPFWKMIARHNTMREAKLRARNDMRATHGRLRGWWEIFKRGFYQEPYGHDQPFIESVLPHPTGRPAILQFPANILRRISYLFRQGPQIVATDVQEAQSVILQPLTTLPPGQAGKALQAMNGILTAETTRDFLARQMETGGVKILRREGADVPGIGNLVEIKEADLNSFVVAMTALQNKITATAEAKAGIRAKLLDRSRRVPAYEFARRRIEQAYRDQGYGERAIDLAKANLEVAAHVVAAMDESRGDGTTIANDVFYDMGLIAADMARSITPPTPDWQGPEPVSKLGQGVLNGAVHYADPRLDLRLERYGDADDVPPPEPPPPETVEAVKKEADEASEIVRVPLKDVKRDPSRIQWRRRADQQTGVEESRKLEGKYDPMLAGVYLAWRDEKGKLWLINGHHRFDLAVRSDVELIDARIIDHTQYTLAEAAALGARMNIAEGHVAFDDMLDFFRRTNLDEETATAQNVLSTQNQRSAFAVAKFAGEDLLALYYDGKLTQKALEAIVEGAGGDLTAQAVGIKMARDMNVPAAHLVGGIQQFKTMALARRGAGKVKWEQEDLFRDDTAMKQLVEAGRIRDQLLTLAKTRRNAVAGVERNPKAARKMLGVEFSEEALKARLDAVRAVEEKLKHYYQYPEYRDAVTLLLRTDDPKMADRIYAQLEDLEFATRTAQNLPEEPDTSEPEVDMFGEPISREPPQPGIIDMESEATAGRGAVEDLPPDVRDALEAPPGQEPPEAAGGDVRVFEAPSGQQEFFGEGEGFRLVGEEAQDTIAQAREAEARRRALEEADADQLRLFDEEGSPPAGGGEQRPQRPQEPSRALEEFPPEVRAATYEAEIRRALLRIDKWNAESRAGRLRLEGETEFARRQSEKDYNAAVQLVRDYGRWLYFNDWMSPGLRHTIETSAGRPFEEVLGIGSYTGVDQVLPEAPPRPQARPFFKMKEADMTWAIIGAGLSRARANATLKDTRFLDFLNTVRRNRKDPRARPSDLVKTNRRWMMDVDAMEGALDLLSYMRRVPPVAGVAPDSFYFMKSVFNSGTFQDLFERKFLRPVLDDPTIESIDRIFGLADDPASAITRAMRNVRKINDLIAERLISHGVITWEQYAANPNYVMQMAEDWRIRNEWFDVLLDRYRPQDAQHFQLGSYPFAETRIGGHAINMDAIGNLRQYWMESMMWLHVLDLQEQVLKFFDFGRQGFWPFYENMRQRMIRFRESTKPGHGTVRVARDPNTGQVEAVLNAEGTARRPIQPGDNIELYLDVSERGAERMLKEGLRDLSQTDRIDGERPTFHLDRDAPIEPGRIRMAVSVKTRHLDNRTWDLGKMREQEKAAKAAIRKRAVEARRSIREAQEAAAKATAAGDFKAAVEARQRARSFEPAAEEQAGRMIRPDQWHHAHILHALNGQRMSPEHRRANYLPDITDLRVAFREDGWPSNHHVIPIGHNMEGPKRAMWDAQQQWQERLSQQPAPIPSREALPPGMTFWTKKGSTDFFRQRDPHVALFEKVMKDLAETPDGVAQVFNIDMDMYRSVDALTQGFGLPAIIPNEVARMLSDMDRAAWQSHPNAALMRGPVADATRFLKSMLLGAPHQAVAYNLYNITTDWGKIISYLPGLVPVAHVNELIRLMKETLKDVVNFKQTGVFAADWQRIFYRGGGLDTHIIATDTLWSNSPAWKHFGELVEAMDPYSQTPALQLEAADRRMKAAIKENIEDGAYGMALELAGIREEVFRGAWFRLLFDHAMRNEGKILTTMGLDQRHLEGLPVIDKILTSATEMFINYANISPWGTRMRQHIVPFWPFQEGNIRQFKNIWKQAFRFNGSMEVREMGGTPKEAQLAILKQLVGVSTFAVIWNHIASSLGGEPDYVKKLGEYDRARMHLVGLRKDEEGNWSIRDDKNRIMIVRTPGAMQDALEYIHGNELVMGTLWSSVEALQEVMLGPRPWTEYGQAFLENYRDRTKGLTWKRVMQRPFNRTAQQINPVVKEIAEQTAGVRFFPDLFKPRPMDDRTRHALGTFSADLLIPVYDMVTKQPTRYPQAAELMRARNLAGFMEWMRDEAGAYAYVTDDEIAYYDSLALLDGFRKSKGIAKVVMEDLPKTEPLAMFRRALRAQQWDIAEYWARKIEQDPDLVRMLRNSVNRGGLGPGHPLDRLSKHLEEVVDSLNDHELEVLTRGIEYYEAELDPRLNFQRYMEYQREKRRGETPFIQDKIR